MSTTNTDNPTLEAEEHVLSTLEKDGSRRWLWPRLSKGMWLQRRRWMAYALIAIFTLVPFIRLGSKPLVLLDIATRRFTILGFTFLPTDTVLLAVFVVGLLLTVFLFTSLFGRVWCGWACPQTVYLEFLFRPIERFFDGTTGRGGKKKNVAPWRTVAKYIVYFLLCVYLANTFLAYFVGTDRLWEWVRQSPLERPVPFMIMAGTTFAMMVDFCFFREQMCLIACPYGRFQSVLLDQNSLMVSYNVQRGDPRGKVRKNKKQDSGLPILGDCIDCGKCVTTCPTGIDIRQGLQMECINCTQCIDACNSVMKKVGRNPDLIRYSSPSRDRGESSGLLRARTIIYPVLLVAISVAFISVFLNSKTFDVFINRELGSPFSLADDGRIRNLFRLKLTNRTDESMTLVARVERPESAELVLREDSMELGPNQTETFHISVLAGRDVFTRGSTELWIFIENEKDVSRTIKFKLRGP